MKKLLFILLASITGAVQALDPPQIVVMNSSPVQRADAALAIYEYDKNQAWIGFSLGGMDEDGQVHGDVLYSAVSNGSDANFQFFPSASVRHLPKPLFQAVAAVHNDYLYVFGGFEDASGTIANSDMYRVNLKALNLTTISDGNDIDSSTLNHSVSWEVVNEYTPERYPQGYEVVSGNADPFQTQGHFGVFNNYHQVGDRLYVFSPHQRGGLPGESHDSMKVISAVFVFDFDEMRWLNFPEIWQTQMPVWAKFPTTCYDNEQYIYMLAGIVEEQYSQAIYRFHVETNTWDSEPVTFVNAARIDAGLACAPDGSMLLSGGFNGEYIDQAEWYNGTDPTWSPIPGAMAGDAGAVYVGWLKPPLNPLFGMGETTARNYGRKAVFGFPGVRNGRMRHRIGWGWSTPDGDEDGVDYPADLFPADPLEWTDFDADGTGDNADNDDDNDGVLDANDQCATVDLNLSADNDGDGCDDADEDRDDDNDGVEDTEDAFPLDSTRSEPNKPSPQPPKIGVFSWGHSLLILILVGRVRTFASAKRALP